MVRDAFKDEYSSRKILREIKILRKLSRIPNNLFTTRLIDVILPEGVMIYQGKPDLTKQREEVKRQTSKGDGSPSNFHDAVVDVGKFTHLFMVIELHQSDMKKLLNSEP